MSRPTITLSAYHTNFTTEAEFDLWVSYVAANIDAACGFAVDVDSAAFSGSGALLGGDVITGATDAEDDAISEAMSDLWERGCSDEFVVALPACPECGGKRTTVDPHDGCGWASQARGGS